MLRDRSKPLSLPSRNSLIASTQKPSWWSAHTSTSCWPCVIWLTMGLVGQGCLECSRLTQSILRERNPEEIHFVTMVCLYSTSYPFSRRFVIPAFRASLVHMQPMLTIVRRFRVEIRTIFVFTCPCLSVSLATAVNFFFFIVTYEFMLQMAVLLVMSSTIFRWYHYVVQIPSRIWCELRGKAKEILCERWIQKFQTLLNTSFT